MHDTSTTDQPRILTVDLFRATPDGSSARSTLAVPFAVLPPVRCLTPLSVAFPAGQQLGVHAPIP